MYYDSDVNIHMKKQGIWDLILARTFLKQLMEMENSWQMHSLGFHLWITKLIHNAQFYLHVTTN